MKIAIIGSGFSGLTLASLICEYTSCEVDIFEREVKLGKKVLVAGNGKCNLTNKEINKENYFNKTLFHYIEDIDIFKFFTFLNLKVRNKLNLIYPYGESGKIVRELFLKKITKARVFYEEVLSVDDGFLKTQNNTIYYDYLFICTGSPSFFNKAPLLIKGAPQHKFIPLLGPVKTYERTDALANERVKCVAYAHGKMYSGEVLFKSDGVSGICVFELSRHLKVNDSFYLDLVPEFSEDAFLSLTSIEGLFSKRITDEVIKRAKEEKVSFGKILKHFTFTVKEMPSFTNSQVSRGGVDSNALSEDFKLKNKNKLYVLGEATDQDGMCGGYNIHYAITSSIKAFNSCFKFNLFRKEKDEKENF